MTCRVLDSVTISLTKIEEMKSIFLCFQAMRSLLIAVLFTDITVYHKMCFKDLTQTNILSGM